MAMVASTPLKKGQEIFNDYGQRPRSDLLRRYGYVTDNAKKWDVVELDREAVLQAATAHHQLNENEKNQRVIFHQPTNYARMMLRIVAAPIDQPLERIGRRI